MTATFDESRRALGTLLNVQAHEYVEGADELDQKDRDFLMVASAANIMAHTICKQAEYDQVLAIKGFEALVGDLTRKIIDLCREPPQ